MPTRLWDVREALASIFGSIDDVVVFNGPQTRSTPPKRFLLVGTDGGETGAGEGLEDGATAEQELSPMGNNWRDERGAVTCAAWAWSGGTDFAPLRVLVEALTDAAEAVVQADRTLGGVLTAPGFAEVTVFRIRETQTKLGAVVRAAFTVSYQGALITT